MIKAKSCSLSSRHAANTNFSIGNTFESNLIKLRCNLFDFLSGKHITDRLKLSLILNKSFVFVVKIHILIQLFHFIKVNTLNLSHKSLFQSSIINTVVMFQKMRVILQSYNWFHVIIIWIQAVFGYKVAQYHQPWSCTSHLWLGYSITKSI